MKKYEDMTREELYQEAKRLNIPGRSKTTKAGLLKLVQEATSKPKEAIEVARKSLPPIRVDSVKPITNKIDMSHLAMSLGYSEYESIKICDQRLNDSCFEGDVFINDEYVGYIAKKDGIYYVIHREDTSGKKPMELRLLSEDEQTLLQAAEREEKDVKTVTPPKLAEITKERVVVMVTGHRPPALGGYKSKELEVVKQTLMRVFKRIVSDYEGKEVVLVWGGALGTDQLAAEVAMVLDIPHFCFAPCQKWYAPWPKESQEHVRMLIATGEPSLGDVFSEVLTPVEGHAVGFVHNRPYKDAGDLQERNKAMVDVADVFVAVYDPTKKGGTANAINYMQKKGVETLIHIDPSKPRREDGTMASHLKPLQKKQTQETPRKEVMLSCIEWIPHPTKKGKKLPCPNKFPKSDRNSRCPEHR